MSGSTGRLCPEVVKILPRLSFALFNHDSTYFEAKTVLTGGGSRPMLMMNLMLENNIRE